MSWDVEIPLNIRYLIGDISATPTYSDEQLQTLILINAIYVQQENSFDSYYTPNLNSLTLRPDPTSTPTSLAPRDDAFVWLVSLKCGWMIAQAELRTAASQAISISDEGSRIDLRGTLEGKKILAKTLLDAYDDARWKYMLGIRPSGQGILGPIGIVTPTVYGVGGGGWQTATTRDRPLFN